MGSKQHDYRNTVVIDGKSVGVFDRFAGGAAPRGNTKRRHGGRRRKTVHTGLPDFDNVTMSKNLEPLRDQELVRKLLTGEELSMTVSRQPIDKQGNALAIAPLVYVGFVENCAPGDIDADSEDLLDYDVEMTVEDIL